MLARDWRRQESQAGRLEAGGRHLFRPEPRALAFAPGGRRFYVTCSGGIWAVDPEARQVTGSAHLGVAPRTLHVAPDGRTVWALLTEWNQVALLDAVTLAPAGTIATGAGPVHVADLGLAPLAFAANAAEGTVSLIDWRTRREVGRLPVGGCPQRILAAPGCRRPAVICDGGVVYLIEALHPTVRSAVAVGAHPHGTALSPCGRFLYVADAAAGELPAVLQPARATAARPDLVRRQSLGRIKVQSPLLLNAWRGL